VGEAAEHHVAAPADAGGVEVLEYDLGGASQELEDIGDGPAVVLAGGTIGDPGIRVLVQKPDELRTGIPRGSQDTYGYGQ